jgi:hypothetical protein
MFLAGRDRGLLPLTLGSLLRCRRGALLTVVLKRLLSSPLLKS